MKERKTYRPKRGVFESTLACNLRCRHCGSSAGKARSDELTTDECKSLFEQLRGIGLEWLTISGGEPTTRSDWAELISLARDTGMKVGMITNAIVFDDDAAKRAKDAGINSIGLSVDGLEETHDRIRGKKGHFKVLEGAMERLKKNTIPFGIITTICNDNLNQLEEMQQYIALSGAYSWQVQLGSDMGNLSHYPEMLIAPRQLPRLEKRLANMIMSGPLKIYCADSLGYFGPHEKILRSPTGGQCFGGCGAGKTNIGIECNGNIKGCLSIMAGYNEEGKDYVEGNIRETPLHEIWNRPGAFDYNREWKRSDLSGFCAACDYAEKCRGGCMGKRVSDGNLTENPMCIYRVIMESSEEPRKVAQAAAVFFAFALSASSAGCHKVEGGDTTTEDSETERNTDSAQSSGKDTATGDVDLYGVQADTETDTSDILPPDSESAMERGQETDTQEVDLYGIQPDTETETLPVDKYGIQPVDTEPDTYAIDEYGIQPVDTETDTFPVDKYGIQPVDTETDTLPVDKYGIQPVDTETETYDVDLYGIQPDTETDTLPVDKYGIQPVDTDTDETVILYGLLGEDDS